MNPVADLQIYDDRMHRSMPDKLFFLDKIEQPAVVFDYGCADGALLQAIIRIWPDTQLFGYDIDPEQISRASQLLPADRSHLGTDFDALRKAMSTFDGPKLLVLSSVIHEVYSYKDDADRHGDQISLFWKHVTLSGFDTIVIRDMGSSSYLARELTDSDPQDVAKARATIPAELVESFENKWGLLDDRLNLVHLLLKYHYADNWDREVNEDYLPYSVEHIQRELSTSGYPITYFEHYVLTYIQNKVLSDTGIQLKDNTHYKLIANKWRI